MIGGFRNRWEIPFTKVQKVIDKSITLIEKTTEYMGDAQLLTRNVNRVVDKVESLVEQEEEVKKLEAERLRIEIEMLQIKRDKEAGKKKMKAKNK